MGSHTIREISETELIRFFTSLVAEIECGTHFDHGNPNHHNWLMRRISDHCGRGVIFFGLFHDDGTPVGFAGLLIEKPLEGVPFVGQKTELLDIGIHPKFRGQGWGKKLLQHAEQLSAMSGAYCMYMATYAASHETITFYGRNGFVPVATLPNVHGPGDEGTVYMRKILK